jgi:hypothetical protein
LRLGQRVESDNFPVHPPPRLHGPPPVEGLEDPLSVWVILRDDQEGFALPSSAELFFDTPLRFPRCEPTADRSPFSDS